MNSFVIMKETKFLPDSGILTNVIRDKPNRSFNEIFHSDILSAENELFYCYC